MANLLGLVTEGGWRIVEQVQFPPDHTGGFFSESYFVEKEGARAFLKALDIATFTDFGRLTAALAGFDYETQLVTHTTSAKLSRVVKLLESGEIEADPTNPVPLLRKLPYLVFELGAGDIRSTVDVSKAVSNRWRFCVLHRAAAGLLQLHQSGIAHQDLKPSNIIRMAEEELKLADLGRSSMRGKAAPHDGLPVAGALSYAPLELTYSYVIPDWTQRRLATDVFHLGCLVVFVFTNTVLPLLVLQKLEDAYQPQNWGDSYENVIPHLQAALQRAVDELAPDFPAEFRGELTALVLDMCHPDPTKRGLLHKAAGQVGTSLWLQKFVSRFDLLQKRASVIAMRNA